jgi:hypothetical protein
MKKIMTIIVFSLCASSISAASLLPADDLICQRYQRRGTLACPAGSKAYVATTGECGCLSSNEVIDPDICTRANIRCNAPNQYFSLNQKRNLCGFIEEYYAGCGCYTVQSP